MEVVFAQGTALISRLIMKVTGGKNSHCALRYGGTESDWMVHASFGGVQPDWWFSFAKNYPSVTRFACLFPEGDAALDLVVRDLGHKGYDYAGLIGQGAAMAVGMKANPFGSRRRYRCTELLTEWMKRCNQMNPGLLLLEFDPEMVTPALLERYYRSRTDLFQPIDDKEAPPWDTPSSGLSLSPPAS